MIQPSPLLRRVCVLLTLLAVAPSFGCSGCKKKKPPAPTLQDEPTTSTEPVEPELTSAEAMFELVLKNCEISGASRIKNCQNGEYDVFITYVRSQGVAIISPMTELMTSSNTDKQRLGAQILRDYIPTILPTADPELIAEGDVRALLAMLQKEEPTVSTVALAIAQPVVALATLKGMEEEARSTIKRFDPAVDKASLWLHLASLKGYASQARLGAFDLIKTTSEDDLPEMKIGALEAAIAIPNWTSEEAERLCTWGTEFMTSENADGLKGKPTELLLRCDRDTWHKKITAEAEKREKAMTYGRPFADNFRFTCPKTIGIDPRKDELCTRQYELLLRVANNAKYSETERKFAITMMGDRWVDDRSVKDIGALKDDRSAEVSRVAELMEGMVIRNIEGVAAAKKAKEDGTYTPPPSGPGEGG